ncbi:MAG TPA: tetratricopeptide repeat protein [Pyrinomonadaceae bacterium]
MNASKRTHTASPSDNRRRFAPSSFVRIIVLVLSLLACAYGMWNSAREGLAQLLAGYGAASKRLDAADAAVRLGRAVPETHYVRAALLADKGERAEALAEYERAVALRPRDAALWLEVGRARDQEGDGAGALAAFREAARLAPFYAAPRWQLGNTLFRAGRLDEAFAELRLAVDSNPKLTPQALELAWAAFGGDAQAIERALRPQTPSLHLSLARFYVKHGKMAEAVAEFRVAGGAATEERHSLLAQLLAAGRFPEAYEVWSSDSQRTSERAPDGEASVLNGGFEEPVILNEPGFGWQLPQGSPAVQAAQDTAEPCSGAHSLRLIWNGNSDTASPVLSQLLLAEPNARYQLSFAARTEKLLSGGLPVVIVTDAGGKEASSLGSPVVLPQGTNAWQNYAFEFGTTNSTRAIRIIVRRQNCGSPVCPAFGRVWLDDFSVRRL